MDERHWWMVSKIQENLRVSENAATNDGVGEFIGEADHLEMLSEFYSLGGPQRLFVFHVTSSTRKDSGRLGMVASLSELKDVRLEDVSILYFFRPSVGSEVEMNTIDQDIHSGLVKGNVVENLQFLLSEVYVPILKVQRNGRSSESQAALLQQLRKSANTLSPDTGFQSTRVKPVTLRLPEASLNPDFKYRITESDQQMVRDSEEIMNSWIVAIETVLADMPNDRLADPSAGPLSELSRQRRRLRLLTSITDQLKVRESKSVMAVVIMAKSRIMKKWKHIDISLTDALNETKDKVRFLESLERILEQLYGGATPTVVMATVLPGLVKALKDSDSVSRFYARQGYLGIVFAKVTNQLAQVCRDYVEDGVIGASSSEGFLWQQLWQEVVSRKDDHITAGQSRGQPNLIAEKVKKRVGRNTSQRKSNSEPTDDGLISRLKCCLLLHGFYQDLVRSLHEQLLTSRNVSHLTSLSSGLNMTSATQNNVSKVTSESKPSDSVSVASLNVGSTTHRLDLDSPGLALGDEQTILSAITQLCTRFQMVIDATNAFSQFHRMSKEVGSFPRPRLEDFLSGSEVMDHQRPPNHPEGNQSTDAGNLQSINEDEEITEKSDIGKTQRNRETVQSSDYDDSVSKGPTRSDIKLLRSYFPEESEDSDNGPRFSDIFSTFLTRLEDLLRSELNVQMILDMGSGQFGQLMTDFSTEVSDLETFLAAYLNAVVIKSLRVPDALHILTSFAPVQNRSTFSGTVSDKYRSIFLWYEMELEEMCRTYEKEKDHPPLGRNAPQVGGAIGWARQLLRKIEEPMRVFGVCKAVSGMREYGRVVKRYNQLGRVLVTYEGLWRTQWKQSVDDALDGLKLPLFTIHQQTRQILVNEDSRVLELIHEAKWLQRFQIDLPDSAHQMLSQESRFKRYRDQLVQCVVDFQSASDSIHPSVRGLFEGIIRQTHQNFLPGLNKIAWNSTNIDVFLHQINSGISRLRDLAEKVNELIICEIESSIGSICQMILIDQSIALSQPWAPRDFAEAMKQSIVKNSNVLKDHLSSIVMAVNEIVSLINEKPGNESHRDAERKSMMKILSQQVAVLLDFYRRDIDDAIISSTVTSLRLLADLCDCHVLPEGRTLSAVIRETSHHDAGKTTTTSHDASSDNDTGDNNNNRLRFELEIKFGLPSIIVETELDEVQNCLMEVATEMVSTSKGLVSGSKESLEETVSDNLAEIAAIAEGLRPSLQTLLNGFTVFEFLWKDDVIGNFREFVHLNRETYVIVREVERLLAIETQLQVLPPVLHSGSICLVTRPLKETIVGFATAWKNLYSSGLTQEAERLKDIEVSYRKSVHEKLRQEVVTLDQLNDTLHLLEDVRDMENKIDGVYRPIEELYMKIRVFEPRLSRSCDDEVQQLRDRWQELLTVAETVYMQLIREKRAIYEQELDKQVKMFVVEVMQLRNAFDAQGPSIPGIDPLEAMSRLDDFQKRYDAHEAKRQTIDSVSKLFSIPCKPFPELNRTGEELKLLSLLYTLYQKFLDFSRSFRDCLWADVDLNESSEEVNGYWLECQGLPNRLKDWDAYIALRASIDQYIHIIPILNQLAAKEIRSRHWMKLMRLTGSSFQLEANVFRLDHVLHIQLIQYSEAIREICQSARHELDLETTLHSTEDDWTEQVLSFVEHKSLGAVCLSVESTHRLLDRLEDARATLALMLTSRYIGPLREEVTGWEKKLNDVQRVMDLWLNAQHLWSSLEAIFDTPAIDKVLPQELKVFRGLDQSWKMWMKRAHEVQNAVECCFLEGSSTASFFDQLLRDLESCFKRLSSYMDGRRSVFPRFHFLSDRILLKILSGSDYVTSVKPHLRSLFSAIKDFQLETRDREEEEDDDVDDDDDDDDDGESTRSLKGQDVVAVSVISEDGDHLSLIKEVPLTGGVDVWLAEIKDTVSASLRHLIQQMVHDVNSGVSCDEWVQKYPGQVCCLGFLFQWTRDCEQAMVDGRTERSALIGIYRRSIAALNGLLSAKARDVWRNSGDLRVSPLQRMRLEAMTAQAMFLRDISDGFSRGKIKEATDFEWRRNLRLYLDSTGCDLLVTVLDERFPYGCEFYSAGQLSAFIPASDKCFISIVLALAAQKNCAIVGEHGVGKTETVKNVAMMTGRHVAWFYCNATSSASAIGRFIKGCAMDGCWSCFDGVHRLTRHSLNMLIDGVQSVMESLRAKLSHCTLTSSSSQCQIPIRSGCSTFMTFERSSSALESMLPDIHSEFREVCLIRPETSMILIACCSRLGLKAPTVLASKLKQVVELARDQLPAQVHHNISLQVLVAVIQCAAQKKRLIRNSIAGTGRPSRLIQSAARNRNAGTGRSGRTTAIDSNRPKTETKPAQQPITTIATSKSDVGLVLRKQSSRRFSSKPLSANIQNEHSLVGQLLIEVIGPRFSAEHNAIFRQIVKDFFPGIVDTSRILRSLTAVDGLDLESSLDSVATERFLVPLKTWKQKCLQLYSLSLIYSGIVVAGGPCSGKSTIMRTLIEALDDHGSKTTEKRQIGEDNKGGRGTMRHRLQRFYPLAADSVEVIFGSADDTDGDWTDGMLTAAWKKANKMESSTLTWFCFDGPLTSYWTDQVTSVLDGAKTLNLSNGDQLDLTTNIRVLFETEDLSTASPAFLARTGILFLDPTVVGWRPIAKAWLDKRTKQEVNVLQKSFEKVIDRVWLFVSTECRSRIPLTEVGLFTTCVNVLSAMLADNREIGGDVHIERLFLFCLMWTFGGLLDQVEQKAFSDLLMTLSNALPDDDQTICIFDYYVDEAGDWDPWQSKVPSVGFGDDWDLLGQVCINTIDTIRTKMLANFALASGQSVLLVGPTGSGKSVLANDLINTRDLQSTVVMEMVASGATSARQMQQFIEANLHHRQGYTYGAKDKKCLQLFIDDINLPRDNECNVPRCCELLRRILDERIICTVQKPFEQRTIEGLTLISTINLNNQPSLTQTLPSSRLLRHFALLHLPSPNDSTLSATIYNLLEANLLFGDHDGVDIDLHNGLVSASLALLQSVTTTLRPSPLPGRQHYLFSLKNIDTCFQTFKLLADESRADEQVVVSLWKHEMNRVVRDCLCRHADIRWFDEIMNKIVEERWPEFADRTEQLYVTFSLNPDDYRRPNATHIKRKTKPQGILQPVDYLSSVRECLTAHLSHYNNEFSNTRLNLQLTDNVVAHVIRLHRILNYSHQGNALLVGSVGSNVDSLVKLALHVIGLPIHRIDSSRKTAFFDGLRSAVRLAGTEDKRLAIVFSEDDLVDVEYVDAIHSILVTGIYPHLFTNDEMDGLLLALMPVIRKQFRQEKVDPYALLLSRIKTNLRIILSLPPQHHLLSTAIRDFPALLTGCQVMWLCDWPEEALFSDALHSIREASMIVTPFQSSITESLAKTFANIHSHMLTYCCQMTHAGRQGDDIEMGQLRKRKDTRKLTNRPHSNIILHENIQNHELDAEVGSNAVFVGPSIFRRFSDAFIHLFSSKEKQRSIQFTRLKCALETLNATRRDSGLIRDLIKTTTKDFESSEQEAADLQRKLTALSTRLEKRKASLGMSTSLGAYLQLNQPIAEDQEEDELLRPEARDEYDDDFDRMREASLKSRQEKAKEELTEVLKNVELMKKNLATAKEQILLWKNKVNRQCIEKLKSAQNPTVLVGNIIEMVMLLVGKRSPGQRLDLRGGPDNNYPWRDEQSGKFSASSSSTRATTANIRKIKTLMREGGGTSDRFDHQQWKGMQRIMSDTVRFVEQLHNIPWEDGIAPEVIAAVESYLARSPDGQLGVAADGSQQGINLDNSRGITIAAAKFSSEDAATLVQYVIAIVDYTQVAGPLATALRKQRDLEAEFADYERQNLEKLREEQERANEEHLELKDEAENVEDVDELVKQLNAVQVQLDLALVHKHNLHKELESMTTRLRIATATIESLRPQESGWSEFVKFYSTSDVLMANCVVASAFLTYCGSMTTDARKQAVDFFLTVCSHHHLPPPPKLLFRDIELIDFLYPPTMRYEMRERGLSRSLQLMLDNACLIMQGDVLNAWHLISDSTRESIEWLKRIHHKQTLTIIKYPEVVEKAVRPQLDACLAEGRPILVTDVDLTSILSDQNYLTLLHSRSKFMPGQPAVKLRVGDHEVECHPSFRLYLQTSTRAHLVPHQLASVVSLLNFHQTRQDVEEHLLDIFLRQEKARICDELISMAKEQREQVSAMIGLDEQMASVLSEENVELLKNAPICRKLSEMKKNHEEAEENRLRAEDTERHLLTDRESFRLIARRGSVCWETMVHLRQLNPIYETSFQQFLNIFRIATSHSDRVSQKCVMERVVSGTYSSVLRFLFERDKNIYRLLLAIELEDTEGRVGLGEREFLISPVLGSVTMTALHQTQGPSSPAALARKPFDWMLDDQFNNLQLLAIHYKWFEEMFDHMARDGHETQWRTLCESDQPELQQLPEKMDDQLTALQRMLIIRAVRSDRLLHLAALFVTSVLGKRYCYENALDGASLIRQSSPTTPILVLYTSESKAAEDVVRDVAQAKDIRIMTMTLGNASVEEDEAAVKDLVKTAAFESMWVLLRKGHSAVNILDRLDRILASNDPLNSQFRCWVTAAAQEVTTQNLTSYTRQTFVKVLISDTKTIKDTLIRSFNYIDAKDILRQSSRKEWPAVLHNLCYLHGAIHLRRRLGYAGWNAHPSLRNISTEQLQESFQLAASKFQDSPLVTSSGACIQQRIFPWTELRFMLSEVVYGKYVSNSQDQQSLSAMVDYWISPFAVRKDFEVPKLKYRLAAAIFLPNARVAQMVQAFEDIPNYQLEVPEACSLHSSTETLFGDDQYIFTRLNRIYDAMPSSGSLSHQLFVQPPSPSKGLLQANVSTTSNNASVVEMGVFSSASYVSFQMKKDIDLYDLCSTMLKQLPKGYTKESVAEKVKKIGGMTSFNLFIIKEIDHMQQLLNEIKNTLQAIKAASGTSSMGDMLSPDHLQAATDLYHQRIPQNWRHLAGNTAPPPNQALASWMAEVNSRCQHFDRILFLGRERMPSYWLGAFFYPRSLLALLKQDCVRHQAATKNGNVEQLVFQTEITARDKDHIRDPPSEGLFIFGIYLWGCLYDKTTGDLVDSPPPRGSTNSMLPVIHVTCWPRSEKPLLQDAAAKSSTAELYTCPVYHSRSSRQAVLDLDLGHSGVQASRWTLRGLFGTIRPY